ncbi:iron ABC transporter substrate-binding protein [Synechococcus sp. KORDI-52]|uniref:extracellular solute-binding protein n=1 Tax=Synechococcus sp. KORDI-52 TaxID=585425 RepID=UPI0004E06481|nr:iron ABC transporter substrate-binding protein [Synechococcus sp. KORDI-52]
MLKVFTGLCLVVPIMGCAAVRAQEVRVYSGRHYNTDRQVFKRFSEKTGIKVRLIEATGISLVERLKREGSNSKADLILLVDAARINDAAKAGLLQSVQSSSLQANIPARYRDPSNRWFGLTRRVRSIIVNPNIVDPSKIRTYDDLGQPQLKGKLCLRKRKNVYNQSLVADQIVLKGQAGASSWVKKMVSNVKQPFFSGDTSLIRAVGQGKCGVGVVNHYYLARMKAGDNGSGDQKLAQNVKLIMPNPAHVNISAAGIAKSAKNKSEALKLIEFLSSPQGSKALAGPTYEYPLKSQGSSTVLKEFGGFTPDNVAISAIGANQKKAVAIMAQAGWH